jgi:nicotinic acid mononucleotide adenylyltransferase
VKKAILLTTGAMNPAHRGHAAMLVSARDRLRAAGWSVERTILSPSHDRYLLGKYQVPTLRCSRADRLELARRVLRDAPNAADIEVGEWESDPRHLGWFDFPEVIAYYEREIAPTHGPETKVVYVCGLDHQRFCGGVRNLLVAERPPEAFSSTAVRAALRRGDRVHVGEALGASALDYIETHRLTFDGGAA